MEKPVSDAPDVVAVTMAWVRHAVVGLNLCPFAKAPLAKAQIRCVTSSATEDAALLADLAAELRTLAAADAEAIETTLLVHPHHLADFLDFNDFLDRADALLRDCGLEGTLQIAPFHPRFQFAGTESDDISNATNRAPYPTLHLLREASVERAMAALPAAEAIFEANIVTLEALGADGWSAVQSRWLTTRPVDGSDGGAPG
jgi:uncharacterized protein